MRRTGHVARTGQVRKVYKSLIGKPEGRPRRRLEDSIEMDLREICLEDVNWVHLAQDRDRSTALVNTAINLLASYKAGNFLSSRAYYQLLKNSVPWS
jgi:hypothetical protein